MIDNTKLFDALNVSAITDLIGEYPSGTPAIFSNVLMPTAYTGEGINFYMDSPYNASLEYGLFTYTINCRTQKFEDSQTLANTVLTAINRKNYSDYYITCSILPTLPRADETDDFNTIVQVILKAKR